MTQRRTFLMNVAPLAIAAAAWPVRSARADTHSFDFSPEQRGRVRAPKNSDAIRELGVFHFVTPGTITVAVAPFAVPIGTYATDARTVIGSDPDYAQLLADALGLKLALVPVAWPDWPLGLMSGKYDAVVSNVGVTGDCHAQGQRARAGTDHGDERPDRRWPISRGARALGARRGSDPAIGDQSGRLYKASSTVSGFEVHCASIAYGSSSKCPARPFCRRCGVSRVTPAVARRVIA